MSHPPCAVTLGVELGSTWGHASYGAGVDPRAGPPRAELLQGGPSREPWLARLTPSSRRRSVLVLVFLLGVLAGGGTAWWWRDPPPPERVRATPPAGDNGVRLVLSGPATSAGGGRSLLVEAVLLHTRGPGSATVTRIHRPGRALSIQVGELPLELSVNNSFERIRLEIHPRSCALATRWTPSAQPFAITWRDDEGDLHQQLGGDHDAATELALIRHMDAACEDRPTS